MLTLTPHIIRTPEITEGDLMPIWVGTESNISFRGGSRGSSPRRRGRSTTAESSAEAEEKIREQVQRLPRGLRSEGVTGSGPAAAEPLGGVNLAPGGAPSNPFAAPPKKPEPGDEELPDNGSASLRAPAPPAARSTSSPPRGAGAVGSGAPGSARAAEFGRGLVRTGFEMQVEIATTSAVAHVPMTALLGPRPARAGEGRSGRLPRRRQERRVHERHLDSGRARARRPTASREPPASPDTARWRGCVSAPWAPAAATVAVAASRIEDAEGYELASVAAAASEVEIRAPEESG